MSICFLVELTRQHWDWFKELKDRQFMYLPPLLTSDRTTGYHATKEFNSVDGFLGKIEDPHRDTMARQSAETHETPPLTQ
jgi:hypothetical protein